LFLVGEFGFLWSLAPSKDRFSMIHTGDWSTADLIKYLVAVRDTLSSLEIDRLKQTSAFMREGEDENGKPTRYLARDLYEPVDTLRDLGLPILFWSPTVKWRAGSDEGKLSS
jgi:hypothetical protein